MKIPVYKGLLETKTTMGVPTSVIFFLFGLLIVLFIFIRSFLAVIPIIFLFIVLKIISKKDPKFLDLYVKNIFSRDYLMS